MLDHHFGSLAMFGFLSVLICVCVGARDGAVRGLMEAGTLQCWALDSFLACLLACLAACLVVCWLFGCFFVLLIACLLACWLAD